MNYIVDSIGQILVASNKLTPDVWHSATQSNINPISSAAAPVSSINKISTYFTKSHRKRQQNHKLIAEQRLKDLCLTD